MPRVPVWRRYLRFFGPDINADVQDELSFHLEVKAKELIGQGHSPEEARLEAARRFGDVTEVSALCRSIGEGQSRKVRRRSWLAEWYDDARHAVRSLRRAPRFATLAVATLAAGIAGTTSLFSLVDAWIIRSVRFPQPRQMFYAQSFDTRQGHELPVSFADYVDLRERGRQLVSLAAWSQTSYTLALADGAERIEGVQVSPNFFSTLLVEPGLGRGFLAYEGEHGREKVAIVSHGFWKARLNGDPAVLGSKLKLNGEPYTIVGVLPERFHLTLVGRANIWTPLAPAPLERSNRQARYLQIVGRMKPGVAVSQARQELNRIAAQLAISYPASNREVGAFCISLSAEIGRHTGEPVLLVVFAVALGLLLMACSNVANLLLVRSLGRKRQAAIQLSLGASRGRLVRQALVETLAVFLLAAAAGAFGGRWLTTLLTGFIPYENRGYLPDYGEASLNWMVLAFVLAVTLFTGLIFGLAPALEGARMDVVSVLKESGSAVSQSSKARRLRLIFVTAQIVLATILLSATAILVEGFRATWSGPKGFDSSGVLTFALQPDERLYPDAAHRRMFFQAVMNSIRVPQQGARIALAQAVPFGGQTSGTTFRLQDQAIVDPLHQASAGFNAVSQEFFAALRTPLLAGRVFADRDTPDSRLVAIVNQAFVTRYLGGTNAVGKSIWLSRMKDRAAEIVGVVGEIREGGDARLGHPQIYVPFAQDPATGAYILVRPRSKAAADDPILLLPEMRRRIAAVDPRQPAFDAKTLDDRLNEVFAPYQIISGMLVWFGLLALILATVGVYGVVTFSVSQRTREIGIRAALGAGRARLLRMFLRQGLTILAAAMLPGMLASIAAGIGLRSLLQGAVPDNLAPPLVFTAAIVGSVVILASLVPARKAASIDPLTAIRYE